MVSPVSIYVFRYDMLKTLKIIPDGKIIIESANDICEHLTLDKLTPVRYEKYFKLFFLLLTDPFCFVFTKKGKPDDQSQ